MKSILVDALREANDDKPESALTDSGSFDASGEDFTETANDEHVADSGELELMSTTDSLELPAELQDDIGETEQIAETTAAAEIDASHAITIVGELPRPVPPQKAPAIARFAPLVTLLAAAAAGAVWMLVNHLSIVPPAAIVDSRGNSGSIAGAADDPGDVAAVAPNFPFIDFEQGTIDEGTTR